MRGTFLGGAAMAALSTIAEIIRDLLIFVAAMTALLVGLIVIVAKMHDGNPLKRLLSALSYRVGATIIAGAVAIPVEPVPGIDALYDIAIPLLLLWYWYTFFRQTGHSLAQSFSPQRSPLIAKDRNRIQREDFH